MPLLSWFPNFYQLLPHFCSWIYWLHKTITSILEEYNRTKSEVRILWHCRTLQKLETVSFQPSVSKWLHKLEICLSMASVLVSCLMRTSQLCHMQKLHSYSWVHGMMGKKWTDCCIPGRLFRAWKQHCKASSPKFTPLTKETWWNADQLFRYRAVHG